MIDISKKLPISSWVYIFQQKSKVLYVWKAKNLKNRVASYFRTWIWVWKEQMVSRADNLNYFLAGSEQEALILEEKLVKKHNPPYNCLLKWDSAYTYIKISKEDFPKIEFTRWKSDKDAIYIWPKPWKRDLKNTLQALRTVFKFRTCSRLQYKKWVLCSDFTMWLCAWYCAFDEKWNKVIKHKDIPSYETLKRNYKKNIKIIKDFFEWKSDAIGKIIKEKIYDAVELQNFEYASLLKNIYIKFGKISETQAIEFDTNRSWFFIKIKKSQELYFMVYVKFVDWKLIDIVKLSCSEDSFLKDMLNDNIISKYEKIWDNFYFAT